eukprot:8294831-Prorocentrum_lima.AAC.1
MGNQELTGAMQQGGLRHGRAYSSQGLVRAHQWRLCMGGAEQLTSGLGEGSLQLLQAGGVLQHLGCTSHSVLTASEGVRPDD